MPSTSSLLLVAALLPACVASTDDGIDNDDSGKQDAGPVRYKLSRTEYSPLNEALDEWAAGTLDASDLGGNKFEVAGPWYKVKPDLGSGLWWRMDIRQPEGADKGLAFMVMWREVGGSDWTFLKPSVTGEDGKASAVGLFSSFKVDNGALEVTSPLVEGTAGSDFFWNDIAPEFAFVPVPFDRADQIAGAAQFEIAITEAE
jgi:hypothetical protein